MLRPFSQTSRWDPGRHTFSSAVVKPRPALTRPLYLTVGQWTTGRSLSTGRGATLAAFARRASRRLCLRPGYSTVSYVVNPAIPAESIIEPIRSWSDSVKGRIRGRTWSKYTRTRRCQSLWKSEKRLIHLPFSKHREVIQSLTVVLHLVVVHDRLYHNLRISTVRIPSIIDTIVDHRGERRIRKRTIVTDGDQSGVDVVGDCWSDLEIPCEKKVSFPLRVGLFFWCGRVSGPLLVGLASPTLFSRFGISRQLGTSKVQVYY